MPAWTGAAPVLGKSDPVASASNFTSAPGVDASGRNVLRQRFDTVAGQSYVIEFAPRAGAHGPASVRTVLTSATAGVTQTSTFDTAGQSSGAFGWRTYSYSFVANGAATTMVFAAADGRAQAASLTPVTVAELPEPAIWGMMLFGFFGLSFAVRRRDIQPKARVRFS